MSKKRMDGKFLDFPLCCLSLIDGDPKKILDILYYCVVDLAYRKKDDQNIKGRIFNTNFGFMTAKDFNLTKIMHLQIAIASMDLGVQIHSVTEAAAAWSTINKFVVSYTAKYNVDAYCRMGTQLTLEVLEGTFRLRDYLVLASIHSILGKTTPYKRIVYKQIAIRTTGYKSRKILITEKPSFNVLTEKQIAPCVNRLRDKNLIRVYPFNPRCKYYSTIIKSETALTTVVGKHIIKTKEKKYNVEAKEMNRKIHDEIRMIKATGKPSKLFRSEE